MAIVNPYGYSKSQCRAMEIYLIYFYGPWVSNGFHIAMLLFNSWFRPPEPIPHGLGELVPPMTGPIASHKHVVLIHGEELNLSIQLYTTKLYIIYIYIYNIYI